MPSVASISELSIICCPFGYFKKEIKDTKGVIRIRKSKKERQHNGQKKKDKRTNNDQQSIAQKH
jgi:hypothetical protein